MNTGKQLLLILALMATLGLLTVQTAAARGMERWDGAYGCSNYSAGLRWDKETIATRTKSHQETRELRRDLAVKQAELRALMQQDNPEVNRAGKLSAAIFDLRETLHGKAARAGIPGPGFLKAGFGGPICPGTWRNGPGRQGRGYGPGARWN